MSIVTQLKALHHQFAIANQLIWNHRFQHS